MKVVIFISLFFTLPVLADGFSFKDVSRSVLEYLDCLDRDDTDIDCLSVAIEVLEQTGKSEGEELNKVRPLFSDVSFIDAQLENIDFSYSNFKRAYFQDTFLKNVNFQKADLESVIFKSLSNRGVLLYDVNFKYADLTNAYFYNTKLYKVNFFKAVLQEANMVGVEARMVNFNSADLSGAKLSGGSSFRGCSFNNANLKSANLEGADFSQASLKGADLEKADLSGADFSGANLSGAVLRYADITGLFNNINVNFQNAIYNEKTVFPEGFDPVSAGMILETYL